MRVIFMGTPAPVIPALERLCRMPEVEVVAAVTPPDRERGRGRRSEPPPVKEAAQRLGVAVLQPDTLRSRGVPGRLAALEPDVIVVAAYGKLLPSAILEMPPGGCLNLHPSLLPRHRGPSPVAAAILEGDAVTGLSLMLLDEGMDTGPVIAQRDYALAGQETTGELTDTLFGLGAELLSEFLGPWMRGELTARQQDAARATVSRKLERADGAADWRLPAETLARQCRAYSPWPALYTRWQGQTLKLLATAPQTDAETATIPPGTVVADGRRGEITVATGAGALTINRLQLEGRRPVSAREFLMGYPDFSGAHLGRK